MSTPLGSENSVFPNSASAPLKSPSAAHTDNKAVQMSGGASPVDDSHPKNAI